MLKWPALHVNWRVFDMGYFIAIEGLDGIGKSTVVKHLAKVFCGHPMGTSGEALHESRKVIMEAFAGDELAKALLYSAIVSSQGRQARSMTEGGEWVFMDRYWSSTIAYAKARGVTANLDHLSKSMIQPDMTILLLLHESERQRRLHARGATVEDVETLDRSFRQCVLNELKARASLVVDISDHGPMATTQMLENIIRKELTVSRV